MSEQFARLSQVLGPRFRFVRLLGRGGAADVYLAEDTREERLVALKMLRDDLAASVTADRFMAEIRVSAQLQHPGIVPILESGDVAGVPYYAMPFIDGESLRSRLTRVGRLRLAETLRITEDLSRALDFAHRRQVVHRDIKPANVMLQDGKAMLLDFGIALALDRTDASRYTSPGLTLGTVEYMSPEQVAGERRIDGRSDVYSLGCMTYEMLAGRPPFLGPPGTVMNGHRYAKPPSLGAVRGDLPPDVARVLARALAKEPAERFPTAGDFLAVLRRASREGPPPPTLGVLTFVHLRPSPGIDAISDRITEEVIHSLRDDGVDVAARTCVPNRDDDRQPVPHLARELDAHALLLGSVSGTGSTLVLRAALFDGRTGARLWSGRAAGLLGNGQALAREPAAELAHAVSQAFASLYRRRGRWNAPTIRSVPVEGRQRAVG
jgi:serine/threonine-protein kinase